MFISLLELDKGHTYVSVHRDFSIRILIVVVLNLMQVKIIDS